MVAPDEVGRRMDSFKLKMKIGPHEIDTEGPVEVVQAQFAAFRELIESLNAKTVAPADPVATTAPADTPLAAMPPVMPPPAKTSELRLEKIMRMEGRVVSLTARGASLEDEILLVLLGQKSLRSNDSVSGGEILDGLRLTGRTVNRIDYQLDKMTEAGYVITVGAGRARRYRLTNQGFAKSQELAMDVLATVA
jgi:hypothetical protein